MPKRLLVVGSTGLPGLEGDVLPCDRASTPPPCDVAVLLGDPERRGDHEELLGRNLGWVRAAAAAVARTSPDCALIVAARPVNTLALAALQAGRLRREKVLGVAGLADELRLSGLVGKALGVDAGDVRAAVLGGCGESLVALPRLWSVGGIPAGELLSCQDIEGLRRAACAGAGPDELAAAAALLAGALLGGARRLCTASVLLEGEYGVDGLCLAVPVVLGPGGWERIVQLNLNVAERAALLKAAAAGRALRETLEVSQ
ncbi:MAG: hypothetical protein HY926_01890 [Elusimicrobia bacterium]|nr:hypothetical protein [Elusimicrobiota bacterium]